MPITSQSDRKQNTNWGQESRLQFIDFRLRWEGCLNRKDLMQQFGVSVPQASLDIAKYSELAPSNLVYDTSSRTYMATAFFQPQFLRSSARSYLAELIAMKNGVIESSVSYIGTGVEVDVAPIPPRSIDDATVAILVRAIQDRLVVNTTYQSMTSIEPSERKLSPHALGYDGFRWHVRAYCHTKKRFSDFVLARILAIEISNQSEIDPRDDIEWHTIVPLVLAPHPDLPDATKRVLELDYGMENGETRLPCRQAFLFYTLKRLGLKTSADSNPIAQQIILKNRADVQPYIDGVTRK